jgi:hypothetical protein
MFPVVRRHFSIPASVRGPVLAPPCSRQRVYRRVRLLHIAGARQGLPDLVLAPHRGDAAGLPLQDGPLHLLHCCDTDVKLRMGSVVISQDSVELARL